MAPMRTAMVLMLSAAAGAAVASTGARVVASQWCRALQAQTITMSRGDMLELVNDESTAVHHAYIDEPDLSYDAGEQGPGGKADIVFEHAGTFTVLCGVHPMMRLTVTVRN